MAALPLLLTASVLIAYSNSLHGELIWDAEKIVVEDPRIRSLDGQHLREILGGNYWNKEGDDLYRPLTTLSYAVTYGAQRAGLDPFGYHLGRGDSRDRSRRGAGAERRAARGPAPDCRGRR